MREETKAKDVTEASLPYRSKAIYYYWNVVSRQEWKLNDDPVESARQFIKDQGAQHRVALLDVQAVPGTKVMAFQVTDFMDAWAAQTKELAMDSTCA